MARLAGNQKRATLIPDKMMAGSAGRTQEVIALFPVYLTPAFPGTIPPRQQAQIIAALGAELL